MFSKLLIRSLCEKWHLHGTKLNSTAFGAPEGRSFGFKDTKYQWSSGHWKFIEERDDGSLKGYNYKDGIEKFEDSANSVYTTDLLTNRAIDFMKEQKANNKKFALMLSLPDPHGPDTTREPFRSKYDHIDFQVPRNARANYHMKPALPGWTYLKKKSKMNGVPLSGVDQGIKDMESLPFFQKKYRNIFGMVKAIDV